MTQNLCPGPGRSSRRAGLRSGTAPRGPSLAPAPLGGAFFSFFFFFGEPSSIPAGQNGVAGVGGDTGTPPRVSLSLSPPGAAHQRRLQRRGGRGAGSRGRGGRGDGAVRGHPGHPRAHPHPHRQPGCPLRCSRAHPASPLLLGRSSRSAVTAPAAVSPLGRVGTSPGPPPRGSPRGSRRDRGIHGK